MDAKKKTILAASLVLLWGGLALWQWRSQQEIVHVPLTNVTGRSSMGRHVEPAGTGLRVNLDLLASASLQHQATFTVTRNIFAVPRHDGTFAAVNSPTAGNTPSAPAETSTQPESGLELEQYRYLGFLRVGDGRQENKNIAMLKRADEVLVLKVGDRVDDHLILKAINSESVTVQHTGTHADQTVALSEEPSREPSGEPSEEQPTGQE